MKEQSRLGLGCKIVGGLYFLVNAASLIIEIVNMGTSYGWDVFGAYLSESGFSFFLSVFTQLLSTVTLSLVLWSVGVLLDRQKRRGGELARLTALLDGGPAPETPETPAPETPEVPAAPMEGPAASEPSGEPEEP